jgi:hypothetical protein
LPIDIELAEWERCKRQFDGAFHVIRFHIQRGEA